ncbi:molybdopterin-dependent oxidoreductase [Hankyongella ginsenosidimutans]|uniref:molybdopterin-dependent oxidoreductase n=1 Tax=Hankyongella ginsenosidimutans TaxID=1763828 RepID=UPI001FECEA8F|nr:molybdopterin-dependent oxidoreductase [Hankyongella ginsenosidimutans]
MGSGAKRRGLRTAPWTIKVGGKVAKPKTFDVQKLLNASLTERVYRLRCVEAWSMVIPWVGFPLAEILRSVEPLGSAKYVAFRTLHDPKQMPEQRIPGFPGRTRKACGWMKPCIR